MYVVAMTMPLEVARILVGNNSPHRTLSVGISPIYCWRSKDTHSCEYQSKDALIFLILIMKVYFQFKKTIDCSSPGQVCRIDIK